ncbi:MAG: hypothetical protein H0T68_11390 [Gemmatimonadales bacterium]|nr:hypothetical protein [Gemmatimonadales bacterium]
MRRLGTIVCLLAPSAARAQLPPVGVPPGVARFELDGAFDIWDDRFVEGTKEPIGAGLLSSSLGATLLASLAGTEARIRGITGIADYQLELGQVSADVLAERGTAMFGLSLGLTRSLTVFGRIPLVRSRVQQALALDPTGANVGPSPGLVEQAVFFQQFDGALSTLASRLAAGDYDADPAQRALAQATLDAGGSLRGELFLLLADPETASPFVPAASSEAGAAITGRVGALQTTLATSLGVAGFSAVPALPAAVATESDIQSFIGDPAGPLGLVLEGSLVTFRGDAEGGVSYTLTDQWDRGARRGGLRAAVEGLVRFPTGVLARTDRLFALGTGDGQTDVELRGTLNLGSGPWGARVEAGYNRQFAANFLGSPAPPALTVVRRDPGDAVTLAVRPFFRIARTFALIGALEHQSRGRDDVTYASDADAIPGVDPDLLAEGTDARATLLALGVTYSNPGALRPGGRGLPVDAGWSYERVLSSGRGIVADVHRVRARLRVYFGVF